MATTISGELSGTSNTTTTTMVLQAAGQSVSGTTLTDSDTFSLTLSASSTYEFAFMLQTTVSSGGMKIALDGTVGVTEVDYIISYFPTDSFGTIGYAQRTALGDAQAVSTSTDSASMTWVFGTIVTSTSGTFKLRFAEKSAVSSVTVLKGSFLRLVKSA